MVFGWSWSSTVDSSLIPCRRTSLTLRSACKMNSLCNDKFRGSSEDLDGPRICTGLIRSVRGLFIASCTSDRAQTSDISSKEGSTHESGVGECSTGVLTRYALTITLTRDDNRITVPITQISLHVYFLEGQLEPYNEPSQGESKITWNPVYPGNAARSIR
jgi:hypothetical protein